MRRPGVVVRWSGVVCGCLGSALMVLAGGAAAAAEEGQVSLRGELRSGTFEASEVFPGTTRGYSVYVPAEYDAAEPASLMVFQDGPAYAKGDGAFRAPAVFDALIAAGQMPVTIAVFVEPGRVVATREKARDRSNRSFEYDSLGDRYVTFLEQELLPVALEGLNVTADPQQRAICGISSGGICAFTAAWERPDLFGRARHNGVRLSHGLVRVQGYMGSAQHNPCPRAFEMRCQRIGSACRRHHAGDSHNVIGFFRIPRVLNPFIDNVHLGIQFFRNQRSECCQSQWRVGRKTLKGAFVPIDRVARQNQQDAQPMF